MVIGTAASYRDLLVWQRSMELAEMAYAMSLRLPGFERFGLADQIRRAAVSVPANIAEGSGRGSLRDYARFLGIAKGSLQELEVLLSLAWRLGYLSDSQLAEPATRIAEISNAKRSPPIPPRRRTSRIVTTFHSSRLTHKS